MRKGGTLLVLDSAPREPKLLKDPAALRLPEPPYAVQAADHFEPCRWGGVNP
jgi:hypothetical protein